MNLNNYHPFGQEFPLVFITAYIIFQLNWQNIFGVLWCMLLMTVISSLNFDIVRVRCRDLRFIYV